MLFSSSIEVFSSPEFPPGSFPSGSVRDALFSRCSTGVVFDLVEQAVAESVKISVKITDGQVELKKNNFLNI